MPCVTSLPGCSYVPPSQVIDEFKLVNQRFGTSEHPFAALDLPCVHARYGHLSRSEVAKIIDPAFHAFNSAKGHYLRLYESVEDTLRVLMQAGHMSSGILKPAVRTRVFVLRNLAYASSFSGYT